MSAESSDLQVLGEKIWRETEKIDVRVLSTTYGLIIEEAYKELQDPHKVNQRLDEMGYNIGTRLIENFLATTGNLKCSNFRETAEMIAKVAFKIYLGITPVISKWSNDMREFSLIINENPLSDFVELPKELASSFWYSNILCGIIRGSLDVINLRVDTFFISDVPNGDPTTEIKVRLKSVENLYSISD